MQIEQRGLARHIEISTSTSQLLTYLACNQRVYDDILVVSWVASTATGWDGRKGSEKQ